MQASGAAITADPTATDLPTHPYRGIRPFRYVDHAIFFAREAETHRLASLVSVYRGVILYGDSGAGKSSLLNAGLIPEALSLGFSPERLRVQPRAGEELVVERIATTDEGSGVLLPSRLAAEGDAEGRSVLSIEDFSARVADGCKGSRLLLIFDQFEELVTLFDDDTGRRVQGDLVELLVALLHGTLPIKVLLSFRDDYLGRVRELLAPCPELIDQALRVAPPAPDSLPIIVSGPFQRYPGHFARPLSATLAQRIVDVLSDRFASGELSLSEVQTVCLRLWQSDDPEALLTARGPQGLLEDYLGEAIDTMPRELRPAAIALLSQMVTAAGTRNVISASDLLQRVHEEGSRDTDRALTDALDRLGDSRLVSRERRRDVDLYEITSEFLVPWISQRREELHRAQEREREHRRLRVLGSIASVLVLVAAAVAALAIWALAQRGHANSEATAARSLALAADAKSSGSTQLNAALVLSLAALGPYRAGFESPVSARGEMIDALEFVRQNGIAGVLGVQGGAVKSVAFSPSGAVLAAGMSDGSVQVWTASTLRSTLALSVAGGSPIDSIAIAPAGDSLATGSANGLVRLWDLGTGRPLASFSVGRGNAVQALAFSSSGRMLAAGLSNTDVRLWDVTTRRPVGRLLSPPIPRAGAADTYANLQGVDGLAFSPNGQTIAAGEGGSGNENAVILWNARTGRTIGPALTPDVLVQSLALSPSGRSVAIGSTGVVEIWNLAGRRRLTAGFQIGSGAIVAGVAFSGDGTEVAGGDDAGVTHVWNLRSRREIASLPSSSENLVDAVSFRPGQHELAIGNSDGNVTVWDPEHRELGPTLRTSADAGADEVIFSPDGRSVAAVDTNGWVSLWNVADGRRIRRWLDRDPNGIAALAFGRDGTELADVDSDRRVTIWALPGGGKVVSVPALRNSSVAEFAVVTPDLRTLITSSGLGRTVRLWRLPGGTSLGSITLPRHETVSSLALDPAGQELAIGTGEGTVWLWGINSRRRLRPRISTFDPASIDDLAFSLDGRTLAEISDDASVRVWNASTGRQLGLTVSAGANPENPDNFGGASIVNGGIEVALSPDGRMLASIDRNSVRLWDVATSQQLGESLNPGYLSTIAFSPNGQRLAAGTGTGVGLWSGFLWSGFAALRAEVCLLTGGNLTPALWRQSAPGIPYQRPCG